MKAADLAQRWGGDARTWYSMVRSVADGGPEPTAGRTMDGWARECAEGHGIIRSVADGGPVPAHVQPQLDEIASALDSYTHERVWVELTVRAEVLRVTSLDAAATERT